MRALLRKGCWTVFGFRLRRFGSGAAEGLLEAADRPFIALRPRFLPEGDLCAVDVMNVLPSLEAVAPMIPSMVSCMVPMRGIIVGPHKGESSCSEEALDADDENVADSVCDEDVDRFRRLRLRRGCCATGTAGLHRLRLRRGGFATGAAGLSRLRLRRGCSAIGTAGLRRLRFRGDAICEGAGFSATARGGPVGFVRQAFFDCGS